MMFTSFHGDHFKRGVSLLEVLVATGILATVVVGVLSSFQLYLRTGFSTIEKAQAILLAEEGTEVLRMWRDKSWDDNLAVLATETPYHLVFNASAWEATTTPQLISDVFTRTVFVEDVYRRDSDSDIVASTSPDVSTLDPGTRKFIVAVSWDARLGQGTVSLESILADLRD